MLGACGLAVGSTFSARLPAPTTAAPPSALPELPAPAAVSVVRFKSNGLSPDRRPGPLVRK
jgi:hypothetical protein